jgi:hypothetical protein
MTTPPGIFYNDREERRLRDRCPQVWLGALVWSIGIFTATIPIVILTVAGLVLYGVYARRHPHPLQ